ncbi:MAG TPA: class I SAM-dependent methyltransferase [Solirubrobacteraceae bacterium]|nr:class I SAM-dependent methyltransferase [Solirubrobacteraceae bacterium]
MGDPKKTLRKALGLPPRNLWPWALPGVPAWHERRWRRLIERTPVITAEEHVERAGGLKEIEEVVACDLCDETRVQPLFRPESRKHEGRWHYHVVRCPSCGFLYRQPGIRPERLGELYAKKYSKFLTGHYSAKRIRRYKLSMKAFKPLFKDGEGRRLFDFGCGTGMFLDLAHERGFETYGVDLSKDSIKEARKKPSGRHAHFGTPRDVPEIAAGGFDVITLWSVLAHLPCPVEDFTMMRELLAPGGALLVLTVNANSLQLKASRDRWNGFTPNHLKFYSPTTLPLLLRRAGFGSVVFRPMYPDGVEAGTSPMSKGHQRRVKRVIDDGNRGNMMRAVAFVEPDAPGEWGWQHDALVL